MDARAWFYSLRGLHSETPVSTRPSSGPKVGSTTVSDYWNGTKWCERLLAWDGEKYIAVETKYVHPPIPERSKDWEACVEGKEEWVTGRGATMQSAVIDLMSRIQEAK